MPRHHATPKQATALATKIDFKVEAFSTWELFSVLISMDTPI